MAPCGPLYFVRRDIPVADPTTYTVGPAGLRRWWEGRERGIFFSGNKAQRSELPSSGIETFRKKMIPG